MGNVVIIQTMDELLKMKKFYQAYLLDKQPPGSVFSAKTPGCMVTAYKSGKVLFQGSGGEQEAGRWGESATIKAPITDKRSKTLSSTLPPDIGKLSGIGSDEVGTGDFFGPITVVAAYVKKEQIPLLKELGVRDSKDLNDQKICAIAQQIKDIIPYSLMTLHNEKYNELQQSGMSQGKMKALLHNQAILKVLEKISPETPDVILIDQFVQGSTYFQHLKGQRAIAKEKVYFSTKAEGIHLAVAAASILARYAFVKHFEKLSTVAGFTIPKGAGAQVDIAAAKLIASKGKEILPKFVKLHFANTDKAFKILKEKKG